MSEIRRYILENAAYFVTTTTKDRRPVFCDSENCRILLVTIEYLKTLYDFKVLAFCIMPDHVHLILAPSRRYDISYVMKMIKGSFARKWNKRNDNDGAVWQKRFYDQVIRNEGHFRAACDYIHQNPVKAEMALTASEYPYSSHRQYFEDVIPSQVLQIDLPVNR